jgi:hypothetical protein
VTAVHEARAVLARLIAEHAQTGQPFSANDLRAEAVRQGVPPGLMTDGFRAAIREGLIERVGDVPSTQARTHGHRVAVYRGVQAHAPVPDRDSLRRKAARLLSEGRVTVLGHGGQVTSAVVTTDVATYRVTCQGSRWHCSGCPPERGCSHVLAVAMVTGDRP